MDIRIVSLNVGKPQSVEFQGGTIETGIYKSPCQARAVPLTTLNFEGDGQADLVNHGGPDKAVCVYPYEHYDFWEREWGRRPEPGAFGENLTVLGMTEDLVCIGDIFAIGDVRLQISQPRQPCFKLGKKHGMPQLPLHVQNTGFTGYYFRVLRPGLFDLSLPMTLYERHPAGLTVAYANRIMHHDKGDIAGIRRLLAVPELSASWRATFEKRLAGNEPSSEKRLQGN